MDSQELALPTTSRLTFHYINGQSESFHVQFPVPLNATPQDVRQEIQRFLHENWWAIKTVEQTIFINAANVLKVELSPPIQLLEGHGVLSDAERLTALNRHR